MIHRSPRTFWIHPEASRTRDPLYKHLEALPSPLSPLSTDAHFWPPRRRDPAMDALFANLSDDSDQSQLSDDSVFGEMAHAFAADQGDAGPFANVAAADFAAGPNADALAAFAAGPFAAAYLPAGAFAVYPHAGAFGAYPPAGPFANVAAADFAAGPNADALAAFAAGPNADALAAFAAGPFAAAFPVGPIAAAAADNDPLHEDNDPKNPWKPVVKKRFRHVRGRSMPLPDPPSSPEKVLRAIKKHAQAAKAGYASTPEGPGHFVFGSFGASYLEF